MSYCKGQKGGVLLFNWLRKSQDNVLPPRSGCISNDHHKEELKHRHWWWGSSCIPAKTHVAVYIPPRTFDMLWNTKSPKILSNVQTHWQVFRDNIPQALINCLRFVGGFQFISDTCKPVSVYKTLNSLSSFWKTLHSWSSLFESANGEIFSNWAITGSR